MKQNPYAELSHLERSEFFRGLLLVMAADGKLDTRELESIREIGKSMDFAVEFIEESMERILTNIHVRKTAPIFEKQETAMDFVKSALTIAFADGDLAQEELEYIEQTAKENKISLSVLDEEIRVARSKLANAS